MRKFILRWVPALAGVALCAAGVVAVFRPRQLVELLPLLLGGVLLALGLWYAFTGFTAGGKSALGLPRLTQGIIDVIVGMVLLMNRSVSVAFLGIVLGLWAVISGVISLRMAFSVRHTYGLPAFLDGALKLGVGLFMITRPVGTMTAWISILGIFGIGTGISVVLSTCYWNRPE